MTSTHARQTIQAKPASNTEPKAYLHDLVCVDVSLMKPRLAAIQCQPVARLPLSLEHLGHLPLALVYLSPALFLLGDDGQVDIQASCIGHSLEHVCHLPVFGLQTGQTLQTSLCIPA